jgi:curved DNA-binding protein CbpA
VASATLFTEINAAYAILGDPDKRAVFDDLGEGW